MTVLGFASADNAISVEKIAKTTHPPKRAAHGNRQSTKTPEALPRASIAKPTNRRPGKFTTNNHLSRGLRLHLRRLRWPHAAQPLRGDHGYRTVRRLATAGKTQACPSALCPRGYGSINPLRSVSCLHTDCVHSRTERAPISESRSSHPQRTQLLQHAAWRAAWRNAITTAHILRSFSPNLCAYCGSHQPRTPSQLFKLGIVMFALCSEGEPW